MTYPNVNDVSNFVNLKVGGQWDDTFCSEPPGEQITRATTVTFGVRHLGAERQEIEIGMKYCTQSEKMRPNRWRSRF